jgi:Polysaccharide deacetylase
MKLPVPANSQNGSNSAERARIPRRLFLLYHELRANAAQYSYVTNVAQFERHADLYARLREAKDAAMWPEITFDDGHLSDLELAAPVLEARGLRAIFFITVGWTGTKPGYMGWDELRALDRSGHAIGAHGWSHKLLTHCSDRELQTELNEARNTLEDKLGISITTMSLPGGRYNRRVLAACEQAGYTTIYTSIPRAETLSLSATVGRLNILGDVQLEWIERLFQPEDTLLADLGQRCRRKEAVKKLLGDRLYAKLWALVNRQEPDADGGDKAE